MWTRNGLIVVSVLFLAGHAWAADWRDIQARVFQYDADSVRYAPKNDIVTVDTRVPGMNPYWIAFNCSRYVKWHSYDGSTWVREEPWSLRGESNHDKLGDILCGKKRTFPTFTFRE